MIYYKVKFIWNKFEIIALLTKENKIAFIGLSNPYYDSLNEFKDILEIEDKDKIEFVKTKLDSFESKSYIFNESDFYLEYLSDNTKYIYKELTKIDYGNYLTYGEFAKLIGQEKAVRSIATKIGKNPIALLIPCHRIISSNKAVKYRYGSKTKNELINNKL
ncbi:methylated-DNA-[protein]-cysteine S-methyltransferase [Spiroplasma sp. TIUS-1]|uniref:methylated-DNA--[protein]-cysteine S-methyltransferase n=1 Tax=Spiroplasma sp. TIUS-1 TaxID=216963 RepID=UPI001397CFBB|nr:methylated-DNA--[protein]-cysteine S-methyltransferase [Spiroplasma sp. TIUS-1]QHX36094.1 methylated-DNA-[protein]-cysteine S-methyltransferase [Spiroplasma sp. TIUS-1]